MEWNINRRMNKPSDANSKFLIMYNLCPETASKNSELNRKASDEKVKSNTAEAILFKKRHKKPKSNEYHNVNILKH